MTHHPRSAQACYLHVYRIVDNKLVLLHKTECDDVPHCLHEFNGRLLVGVGRALRMYELGKKKLLRKAERSEEHTSELQSLMRISYAVFCLKKKNIYDY